jgi:hypothetical protein
MKIVNVLFCYVYTKVYTAQYTSTQYVCHLLASVECYTSDGHAIYLVGKYSQTMPTSVLRLLAIE